MLAGWAAAGSAPLRPNCSLAETQRQAFLRSGGWGTEDEAGYMRYCGPGRVVMQVDGRSLSIEGGSCSARRVRFGVLWNRVGQAPVGRGLWMLLEPGKRRGRIDIVDGEIQFPGVFQSRRPHHRDGDRRQGTHECDVHGFRRARDEGHRTLDVRLENVDGSPATQSRTAWTGGALEPRTPPVSFLARLRRTARSRPRRCSAVARDALRSRRRRRRACPRSASPSGSPRRSRRRREARPAGRRRHG